MKLVDWYCLIFWWLAVSEFYEAVIISFKGLFGLFIFCNCSGNRLGEWVKVKISERIITFSGKFSCSILSEWLKISKWVTAFLGKLLTDSWFIASNLSYLYFIKCSVINSEFIFINGILNSADSEGMTFNHMSKVEIDI